MTFPALQGRSDPRVLCGILADQFLHEVNPAPASKPDDDVTICLVNLIRLMDMYRNEVMQSIPEPSGILQRDPAEFIDWIEPESDPLQDLDEALSFAQHQVFGEEASRGYAADSVRAVLSTRLAGKAPPADQMQQTARFFEALIDKLGG